jgi:hypothetical protein
MYKHVHSCTSVYTHVKACTLMYNHVHSCTRMYNNINLHVHSSTIIHLWKTKYIPSSKESWTSSSLEDMSSFHTKTQIMSLVCPNKTIRRILSLYRTYSGSAPSPMCLHSILRGVKEYIPDSWWSSFHMKTSWMSLLWRVSIASSKASKRMFLTPDAVPFIWKCHECLC